MLASIVGNVNIHSAAVLVSFFGMLTIVGAIWFAKRRSRLEIDHDFELAKIRQGNSTDFDFKKLSNNHEENRFKLETERVLKLGQLEKGLITSHKSKTSEENPKVFQKDS